MSLRCGGICNDHFIANFVLSQAQRKNFGNRLIFCEVIDTSRASCFFDSHCIIISGRVNTGTFRTVKQTLPLLLLLRYRCCTRAVRLITPTDIELNQSDCKESARRRRDDENYLQVRRRSAHARTMTQYNARCCWWRNTTHVLSTCYQPTCSGMRSVFSRCVWYVERRKENDYREKLTTCRTRQTKVEGADLEFCGPTLFKS